MLVHSAQEDEVSSKGGWIFWLFGSLYNRLISDRDEESGWEAEEEEVGGS